MMMVGPGETWRISGTQRAAEELDEAIMDDADELLPRLEGLGDIAPDRVGLHARDEVVRDIHLHIGLEQRVADIRERLGDVGLGDRALAGEFAEDIGETVGEAFEHAAV